MPINYGNVLEEMDGWEGFKRVQGHRFTEAQIANAVELLVNAKKYPNHLHQYLLQEAITTTDFPNLFGTFVDREMLARYKLAVPAWRDYVLEGTVSNFNVHTRHRVSGLTDYLPQVAEKGEYLPAPVSDETYNRQVFKRGRQFDISWEALINDGMGAFADIPQRFADAAINTEARLVTDLYASAGGPDAALYATAVCTNAGTLALSIANLETTCQLMAMQTDPNGNPMGIRAAHLVVPPALEYTARQILTSATKMWMELGGAGGPLPYPTANVISQVGIKLHVDYWLPIVATTNVNTTWYLFADKSQGVAIGFDRLRGHETPEICMKASNKVSITGAPISPFAGDFESDDVFYRVRVVNGGNRVDPRNTYAQIGTG